MHLNTTSQSLQVVLSAAKATNDCPVVVSYRSLYGFLTGRTNAVETPAPQVSTTNGITAATILSAPAANQVNVVQSVNIYNADTAAVVVTVQLVSAGTTYILNQVTLQIGESLCYSEGQGWYALRSNTPSGRIAVLNAAGTPFDTYTTAKTILPASAIPTLAANWFTIGKTIEIEGVFGLSTLVTTPGTFTLQVMLGSVIAFTTGAIQMNATAHTLLPVWFRILLTCRAVGSGTSANLMGQAMLIGKGITVTAGQTDGANSNTALMAPATAPAVGTGFDSTASQALDLWNGFSISNAANGIQMQQYKVSAQG